MAHSKTKITGFQLKKKIRSGTALTQYLALRKRDDRPVLLHVLSSPFSDKKSYVKKFTRKVRIVTGLHEEPLVSVLESGSEHGIHYFVTERFEGTPLSRWIQKKNLLNEKACIQIGRQVARALYNTWNIDHLPPRNITPQHILINQKNHSVKLFDPCLPDPHPDTFSGNRARKRLGSPHYKAPEQALKKQNVDDRTDIYGLGATLYHALTGQVPFDGKNTAVILKKTIQQKLTPPGAIRSDLDTSLGSIIEKMMEKKPRKRFQHPEPLIDAFDRAAEGEQDPLNKTISNRTGRAGSNETVSDGDPSEKKDRQVRYQPGGSSSGWTTYAIAGGVFFALIMGAWLYSNKASSSHSSRPHQQKKDSLSASRKTMDQKRVHQTDSSDSAEAKKKLDGIPGMIEAFEFKPRKARKIRAEIDRYKKNHPDSTDRVQKLETAFDQAVKSGAKTYLSRFMKRVKRVREDGNLAQAFTMLSRFPAVYRDTPAARTVKKKKEEIKQTIEDRFTSTREQILSHIKKEQFQQAKKRLKKSKRNNGKVLEDEHRELTKKLEEKRARVQARKRKKRERERKAREKLNEFVTKLKNYLTRSERSILGSSKRIDHLFQTYREEISIQRIREKMNVYENDVELLKTFARRVLNGADRSSSTGMTVKLSGGTGEGTNGRITGHKGNKIQITLSGNGGATVSKPIHELPMHRQIQLALGNHSEPDAKLHFAAGLAAYYADEPYYAKRHLEKAVKQGISRAEKFLKPMREQLQKYHKLFAGDSTLLGNGRFKLTYNFSDRTQTNDWKTHTSANGRVNVDQNTGDGHVTISGKGSFLLRPRFKGDLTMEATVYSPSGDPFGVFLMATEKTGYLARLDKRLVIKNQKTGQTVGERYQAFLLRADGPDTQTLNENQTGQLIRSGTSYNVRGVINGSEVKFLLNEDNLLAGRDQTYRSGFVGFFVRGMKYQLKKVTITGRIHPDWLEEKLKSN